MVSAQNQIKKREKTMSQITRIEKSRKAFKCQKCGKELPVGTAYLRGKRNFAKDSIRCTDCGLQLYELSSSDMEKHIEKNLDLTISLDEENVAIDICEPESGERTVIEAPLSFDEHPEFSEAIGNEIYSWLSLWSDELKEMENDEREDDETDGSDEPSAGNPVQEAYNILRAALNGEDGVGDAEAIETALGFLGEALA